VTLVTQRGTAVTMSESAEETEGRHAAPDDDPNNDPPSQSGDSGGDHRAGQPDGDGDQEGGDGGGGAAQPGADPEDEAQIEAEREERLDPDNRPDNVEVDNSDRDFDPEKGMFADSEGYEEAEPKFPGIGEQGA
jgi:hypothetical protein